MPEKPATKGDKTPLLKVEALELRAGTRPLLKGLDFSLDAGRITALVGGSGAGKTLTALSLMRLLPRAFQTKGVTRFEGQDLLRLDENRLCRVRGRSLSMVFQEPMTALNPLMTIGEQIGEPLRLHKGLSRREAFEEAVRLMVKVGLDPERISPKRYPHELSGGQRQRVVIAQAIACGPKLLIADEVSSALDVTNELKILELFKRLVEEEQISLLFITHDLSLARRYADHLLVLHEGALVEQGKAPRIFLKLRHPYSKALFADSRFVPRKITPKRSGQTHEPLLAVKGLKKSYRHRGAFPFSPVQREEVLKGVSFLLHKGEALGLVGESGCGKSTLARAVLGLEKPDAGKIRLAGQNPFTISASELKNWRRRVQIVFQDPFGSFNPRHRASRLVSEPLFLFPELTKAEKVERLHQALNDVGLKEYHLDRYPHAFSGGQRQRLAIARALITLPDLIVLDEPLSSLDVSIRAQILRLLVDLRERIGLSYLFITHDLSLLRTFTDRVLVLHEGHIVEQGLTNTVLTRPEHPQTQSLLASDRHQDGVNLR